MNTLTKLLLSYRGLIYLCILLSGAAALTFQVVWQRYLSFLVGSEARSISLVVATFLLGLAAGYRFWGKLTERNWTRKSLLKAVGYIELGIAAYALLFPYLFPLVRDLAYAGPDWLLMDFAITGILLFPPTFLMGASIPLLTSAVPVEADEVHYCHSRIYGINTLGAFLGALAAGFVLVPAHGLHMSLVYGALVNIVAGLVFLCNPLDGPSHKAQDIPRIPNSYGAGGIYLFVFTTGAVSIGLEVLFMRIMSLSIGSGHYVFPIVVGVVILGLAIGSLSLRKAGMTERTVPRELWKISVILALLYLSIPFWPYWMSHVRISLSSIPSNYAVFLVLVVLCACAAMLPLFIPLGRLLPTGFALIDKTRDDYGNVCGRVYFANTIGTVAGAVGIGYALFGLLDLPTIFKLNIAMLMALASVLCFKSARPRAAFLCGLAGIAAFFLPAWNRDSHCFGLFRIAAVQDYHFRGAWSIPSFSTLELKFLRDDPTSTVSAYSILPSPEIPVEKHDSMTIAVNGKSDGNTIGDYSNMVLAGLIPYLYSPHEGQLRAAVVGLGTGMTSGALAKADDVQSVTTLEISPAVIEALPFFDEGNFELSKNPKSRMVQADGFRFFTRSREKFDIIVSEPSNPWVVGVENLFTPEFYQLVSGSLNRGGMFCQWIQMYDINGEILAAIAENLLHEFEHVSMFVTGAVDVAVLASHEPFAHQHLERRLAQPSMQIMMHPMGIDDPAILSIMEVYQTAQMSAIAKTSVRIRHSVEFPWIGHAAGKAAFLHQSLSLDKMAGREIAGRHLEFTDQRASDFTRWMSRHGRALEPWCKPVDDRHSAGYMCTILGGLAQLHHLAMQPALPVNSYDRLHAYSVLRDQGFMPADIPMLAETERTLLQREAGMPLDQLGKAVAELAMEYARERRWDDAVRVAEEFRAQGAISQQSLERFLQQVHEMREQAAQQSRRPG